MPHKTNTIQIETEKKSITEVSSYNNDKTSELPISRSSNYQLNLVDDTYDQSAVVSLIGIFEPFFSKFLPITLKSNFSCYYAHLNLP